MPSQSQNTQPTPARARQVYKALKMLNHLRPNAVRTLPYANVVDAANPMFETYKLLAGHMTYKEFVIDKPTLLRLPSGEHLLYFPNKQKFDFAKKSYAQSLFADPSVATSVATLLSTLPKNARPRRRLGANAQVTASVRAAAQLRKAPMS